MDLRERSGAHRVRSRHGGRTVAACALLLFAPSATADSGPTRRGGTPTGQHAAAVEADLDDRIHRAMELVYASQLAEATRLAAETRRMAPHDPRVHLLEARLLRETFPEQNHRKDGLEPLAAPVHAALDRAVQCSDSLIANGLSRTAGFLYRGWAHLFHAQMHAFCEAYWSAGRHAKQGKEDLDRTLALQPGNTDAQGILGTYLYFADIMPRAVKIARAVVRVPGGDRARGLELLRSSASGSGYNALDAQALLAVIALAFDGDQSAGAARFEALLADHPGNPRLLEPLAALDVLRPEHAALSRTDSAVGRFSEHEEDLYRDLASRLAFYQALTEMLRGHLDDARRRLTLVRRHAPAYPDWFASDVALCLVEAHLLAGDGDAARAERDAPGTPSALRDRLRFLDRPGAVPTLAEAARSRDLQAAARALYADDLEAAASILAACGSLLDPGTRFYRGELARRRGERREALAVFRPLTEMTVPDRWRLYKTLAFARTAELLGEDGDAEGAARMLGLALDYDQDRDFLRHLLRARQRYWDMARRPSTAGSSLPVAARAPGP